MPHAPKYQRYAPGEDIQAQTEVQDLVDAQVPAAEEEEEQNLGTQDGVEVPAAVAPSTHQSPERSFSVSTSLSISDEDSSNPQEEASVGTESLPSNLLEEKIMDLVQLLLRKYQMRQPITKAEMLNIVIKTYKSQFSVIFQRACKCMAMVFGIDVKEVDPTIHSYAHVNSLDLTYVGMLSDDQSMPKNGLLILILGMIFLEGNCTSEEEMYMMEVYAGREHYIYEEPSQLTARDWVQENYLEYQQVPSSDPAHYEFLWGPRAHAETSKMKVLEFLAEV
uniref:MAGE domain-containing protein n=1 Tax=Loxodonta africana TaxID=9785 RepID=G3U0U3_LOXAF